MRIGGWSSDVCASYLVAALEIQILAGRRETVEARDGRLEPVGIDADLRREFAQRRCGLQEAAVVPDFRHRAHAEAPAILPEVGGIHDRMRGPRTMRIEILAVRHIRLRSEGSSVGKECGSKCRSRWAPYQ